MEKELSLWVFCDANFNGDEDDSKPTSGIIFKIAGTAVSWGSKLQRATALSTSEAEYVAAGMAGRDAEWLRELLSDMGFPQESPTLIATDSQGALGFIRNPLISPKTKHIMRQWHYVKQQVEEGVVQFEYVPSKAQVADALTMALPAESFKSCRAAMGLFPGN